MEQGFDSLMAVQLRTVLGKNLGASLPVTTLFNYPTIDDIVGHLMSDILEFEDETSISEQDALQAKAEDEFDYLDELSDTELDTLIEQELDNISA